MLSRYRQVLVPELNRGQLALLLRSEFLIDAERLCKVEGQPFRVEELRARIQKWAPAAKATAASV